MSTIHNKRTALVIVLIISLGAAMGLILYALKQNINLFYTPTEVIEKNTEKSAQILSRTVRVGGMIKKGSIQRGEKLNIQFTVTDFKNDLVVYYNGILPDLFKENQGVVILGALQKEGYFKAYEVLAKHDENYMPSAIKASLDKTKNQQEGKQEDKIIKNG